MSRWLSALEGYRQQSDNGGGRARAEAKERARGSARSCACGLLRARSDRDAACRPTCETDAFGRAAALKLRARGTCVWCGAGAGAAWAPPGRREHGSSLTKHTCRRTLQCAGKASGRTKVLNLDTLNRLPARMWPCRSQHGDQPPSAPTARRAAAQHGKTRAKPASPPPVQEARNPRSAGMLRSALLCRRCDALRPWMSA